MNSNKNDLLKRVERLYDERAYSSVDAVKASGGWGSKELVPEICEEIGKKLGIKKDDKILEVGCGSGVLGSWVAKHCYLYCGLDISLMMIKKFRDEYRIESDYNLIQSITDAIPFRDNFFDIIIINGVTMYLHDKTLLVRTLNEMERVANDNATIFIGENVIPNGIYWEWNNHLKKSTYSTYFQTAEYVRERDSRKIPIFIYVKNSKNEIKGQLAVLIITSQPVYSTKKFIKYTKMISKFGNRGSWVNGPIIHSDNEKERIEILRIFLEALDSVASDHNLMIIDGYSCAQDNISEDYKNELKRIGYKIRNFKTFRADLNEDIEKIWKKVSKSARNDVTRAQRREISVKELEQKKELLDYELLGKKWAKTKGIEISDPHSLVEDDWKDHLSGIQKYFLAYQNEELISGLRVGCFNGIAFTNQVRSSYSKASSLGGPLLTWYAIEWAKNHGMRIYDFSGVAFPNDISNNVKKFQEQWEGLTGYKRKWGGNEYPYYQFIKVRKKLAYKSFRLLSKPDSMYRNFKKKKFKRPTKE